ncbi:hypothetical protein [Allopontixanthobacter sp.]|uniref:hypothetical protein n=1 Tax=Allopontixanthobacter sp. TaxID=2906452 RepID=UPI002AB99BD8|nr:hypothetical protein [Allopontixanthobacter sp.]MDZ4307967.1 hypothetical protein [Allopontixanthobacter sp.]
MEIARLERVGGVLLLFESGRRLDPESVRKIVDKSGRVSISLDPRQSPDRPAADPASDGALEWLELLIGGMTFDLVGLAPGRPVNLPDIRHRVSLPEEAIQATCEALCLVPGPHLAGGANTIPVVRTLFELIALLAADMGPQLRTICWPPAALATGPEFFRSQAESWQKSGAFPSRILAGYRQMSDGGLQSEGLAFFTGQEIRIEPESVGDCSTAVQLASRLVQQLAQHGPLTQSEEVIAPDGGQMRLVPSGNGKFVRVWRN